MKIEEVFARRRFIMLDGAMGTQLQLRGLTTEQKPELAAFIMPDVLTAVHRDYARAGADILLANTFGANPRKLKGTGYTVQQVIEASIACARTAAQETGALVALDIGPIGELLAPAGTLPFEDACAQFAEMVRAGAAAGADLVFLETMTDLYELKAAILAAKENCDLPVFTSMSFEARGRTFTGCTVESYGITAAGLGADAVGINCSLGPKEILPFAQRLCRVVPAGMPVFVKPNAGLPNLDGSYDITPAEFAAEMAAYLPTGISMLGGCCGSEPESIRLLKELTQDKIPAAKTPIVRSRLCTPVRCVEVNGITVVGERINPTGKKRFKAALQANDMDYILDQAVQQVDAGADLLDVNVGMPGIDEKGMMIRTVKALQSIGGTPLQLDSTIPAVMEAALRVYNGKPIVNSVNGEEASLQNILPLVKKYGAAVVGLTLDENGIPKKAADRFAIAKRILDRATALGIPKRDVYIDCLTLTASAEQDGAKETLEALHRVKTELGLKTVLGVSNISFGLPNREAVTRTFLTMALENGLDLPIINPNIASMAEAVRAFRLLRGFDVNCAAFVEAYANMPTATAAATPTAAAKPAAEKAPETLDLPYAMSHGLKNEGAKITAQLLETTDAMEVVNDILIPALDSAGKLFEQGKIFLPQLIQTASVAQAAFDVIKTTLIERNAAPVSRGEIVLATVKGDIHDIGKNIVRVLLENYGYTVLDLGRDVPCQLVADTAKEHGVKLVGLSALMTTTLGAMEETIQLVKASCPDCKIVVGGAVLTADYAEKIGADYYAKDAMETVAVAKEVVG